MRSTLLWLLLGSLMVCVFWTANANMSHTVAAIQNNKSINSSMYINNTSSIQYREHSAIIQAPNILVIGGNYYADHPVSYDSQTGQKTWIKNRAEGISINHEISSTHNLSQTLEMTSQENSLRNEFGVVGSSGVQMKVKEDVQEGKVSMGVLKGGIAENGQPPSETALRNPSIDIEEDYIGNFHIEKNMTIGVPFRSLWFDYSWLSSRFQRYMDPADDRHKLFNAVNIFDYTK